MKLNIERAMNLSIFHAKILKSLHRRPLNTTQISHATKQRRLKDDLMDLVKQKFIKYDTNTKLYEITISGFDAYSINKLKKKGLSKIYGEIGTGKEAEIYKAKFNGRKVAIKFHRVGKNSFKSFKRSRVVNNKKTLNAINKNTLDWRECSIINRENEEFYLKEFAKIEKNIPEFVYSEKHILLMEFIEGPTLFQIKNQIEIEEIERIYDECLLFIEKIYKKGFVHNDFNEFNVMLKEGKAVFIDFPQVIEKERNINYAQEIYEKDKQNIKDFFRRRFQFIKN